MGLKISEIAVFSKTGKKNKIRQLPNLNCIRRNAIWLIYTSEFAEGTGCSHCSSSIIFHLSMDLIDEIHNFL